MVALLCFRAVSADLRENAPTDNIPGLRSFLHHGGDILGQDPSWGVLAIQLPVSLSSFACFGDEHSEVRAHAGIYNS